MEPRHSALKTLALLAMGERAPSQVTVKRHSLELDSPRKVTSKGHHTQQRSPLAKILASRYVCGLTMSGYGYIQHDITVTDLTDSGHSLPLLLVRDKRLSLHEQVPPVGSDYRTSSKLAMERGLWKTLGSIPSTSKISQTHESVGP